MPRQDLEQTKELHVYNIINTYIFHNREALVNKNASQFSNLPC